MISGLSDFTSIEIKKDVKTILYEVHKELEYGQTWKGRFVAGWNALEKDSSKRAMTTYKVGLVFGGLFATVFVLGSSTFGCLAMEEAVEAIRHGETPAIMGHFAEWTVQALFAGVVFLKTPYGIACLGNLPIADNLFDPHIGDLDLSRKDRETVYKAKLNFKKQQPQASFFYIQDLPDPGVKKGDIKGLIGVDVSLKETYQEIKKELNISGKQLVKLGWKEILKNKSACYSVAMKLSIAATSVLFAGQFAVYSAGIYWSGEEAVLKLQEGENPSIGGHCLEWAGEMAVAINAAYSVAGEVANVGTVKNIVEVFQKHMLKIKNEKKLGWEKKVKRLQEVLLLEINTVSPGYFFSLPTHLLYESSSTIEELTTSFANIELQEIEAKV